MRFKQRDADYAKLRPGAKNPLGLQVCRELATEFLRNEDDTWVSAACTAYPRRECVMPEECHHKQHGPKEAKDD